MTSVLASVCWFQAHQSRYSLGVPLLKSGVKISLNVKVNEYSFQFRESVECLYQQLTLSKMNMFL